MKIDYTEDSVIITGIPDFIPKHVFECGQCFRWDIQPDGSYTGVAHKRVINVKRYNDSLVLSNTSRKDFEGIWFKYFDLGREYSKIRKALIADRRMKEAVQYGRGLRILNQDEWECLVSFIISANKSILQIKRIIEDISFRYGEYITSYRGKDYFSFPDSDRIAELDIGEIRSCKVGYRDKYIHGSARHISANKEWLYTLKDKPYEVAHRELKTLDGVGEKVSNCVMLFSMAQFNSFPVDVWMHRVMKEIFSLSGNNNEIKLFAEQKFGRYSGFAQQYLFYYAKENNVGKKDIEI
ncbi:MAG TPA: 8-oxoguanine DNA glycosylase [Clostridiales bacterium]|jgi:N-glycosylase/DNA lyase|nr:8-oxoguanine DNA glycosylase [Clostridiales bacterium]